MTDAEAVREIGWVAREARALVDERVQPGSDRWLAYLDRKRAVIEHIERRERERWGIL
jgi:hypothetical protein